MRALVMSRQQSTPPLETMPMMVAAFNEWRNQYRDKMEHFSFFTNGTGGCGIVTVADEMELYEITSSFPFAPFSNMTAEVLIDGDAALQAFTERINAMAAQIG